MEPVIPHKEELRAGLRLIKWALEEDLSGGGDRTSTLLIDQEKIGRANIVARQSGTVAGIDIARNVFHTLDPSIQCKGNAVDADRINTADVLMEIEGNIRTMLSVERVALNFLTHLSGIATLTAQFVAAVSGTKAQIFDTRKTIPGWRRLEKYAVRAGGGGAGRSSSSKKRNHDFVVAAKTKARTAVTGWPIDHMLLRSILLDHVEVGRSKMTNRISQFSGYCQGLEKNFGQDNRRAEVENDTTVIQIRYNGSQQSKITETGLTNCCPVGLRVLMDNIGANLHMNVNGQV